MGKGKNPPKKRPAAAVKVAVPAAKKGKAVPALLKRLADAVKVDVPAAKKGKGPKYQDPMQMEMTSCVNGFTIKVDKPSSCWRITHPDKPMRCASYKSDPKNGWDKVLEIIRS